MGTAYTGMEAYLPRQRADAAGAGNTAPSPRRRKKLRHRPTVGEVQVREEEHPAAEEREQHDHAVELVQQSVLLLVLKGTGGE